LSLGNRDGGQTDLKSISKRQIVFEGRAFWNSLAPP